MADRTEDNFLFNSIETNTNLNNSKDTIENGLASDDHKDSRPKNKKKRSKSNKNAFESGPGINISTSAQIADIDPSST